MDGKIKIETIVIAPCSCLNSKLLEKHAYYEIYSIIICMNLM